MTGPCEHHSGLENAISNLKESDVKQWQVLDKLQNRLPLWATTVISILTFLLGFSASWAGFLLKSAGAI